MGGKSAHERLLSDGRLLRLPHCLRLLALRSFALLPSTDDAHRLLGIHLGHAHDEGAGGLRSQAR